MSRKKNRKHSKIDKLPVDLRDAVDMMLQGDFTYQDVADYIRDNSSTEISVTAVFRYAQGLRATLDDIKMAEQNFRIIAEELSKHPNLDTTEAIARIVSHKVLTAIQEMPEENWGRIDPSKLIAQATTLIRTVSYKRDMDSKLSNIKTIAVDSLKDDVFNAMAGENPELYRAFIEFLETQKEVE